MVPMLAGPIALLAARARELFPVVVTLALLVAVMAVLASTYVGDSRSPYNTCYGTDGRAISCAVLEAVR
jgi:hypothetical protein